MSSICAKSAIVHIQTIPQRKYTYSRWVAAGRTQSCISPFSLISRWSNKGAGGVHHVAFRSRDTDYDAWVDRLNEFGIPDSGKVDRYWFRSLYVREANGVLFEIATHGPGFAVDEDPSTLGEKLVLPPFLEPHHARILADLKAID